MLQPTSAESMSVLVTNREHYIYYHRNAATLLKRSKRHSRETLAYLHVVIIWKTFYRSLSHYRPPT